MKLITRFELARKDTHELHALLRELFNKLACKRLPEYERSNTLASMQNIQNELIDRCMP